MNYKYLEGLHNDMIEKFPVKEFLYVILNSEQVIDRDRSSTSVLGSNKKSSQNSIQNKTSKKRKFEDHVIDVSPIFQRISYLKNNKSDQSDEPELKKSRFTSAIQVESENLSPQVTQDNLLNSRLISNLTPTNINAIINLVVSLIKIYLSALKSVKNLKNQEKIVKIEAESEDGIDGERSREQKLEQYQKITNFESANKILQVLASLITSIEKINWNIHNRGGLAKNFANFVVKILDIFGSFQAFFLASFHILLPLFGPLLRIFCFLLCHKEKELFRHASMTNQGSNLFLSFLCLGSKKQSLKVFYQILNRT